MNTNAEKLLDCLADFAEALGLDKFEHFTVKGAAGLIVAIGRNDQPDGYEEVIYRYTLDGNVFEPNKLTIEERRQWVKMLCIEGSTTQMDAADFLDVSQSLISRDLHELKKKG